jgi:4-amino-4-deoxy-L-arabinose transferase-like glycosyltransferase
VLGGRRRRVWLWGAALVGLSTALRAVWVLSVPTVPVSDFAMYRESANYLSEFGHLDHGFIYMPGFVALLAAIKNLGGDLLAQKLLGVFFGGLGAAGLFVLTRNLADQKGDEVGVEAGDARPFCPCPHAAVATAIYALWPAGLAMSSVVGTDMPAAALVVAALALLVALAPARPWTAALAFGAAMGLAAWVRAVALPLSALTIFYWLARRSPLRRALGLTAAGLAAALVVLSPWALRHVRQSGALYFTDDHGGITALIGANPNSEGTYTRALNQMFKDVTGRSVLDEPHRATDQAAYSIVREWTRFEPRYTLGLVALKADRLFDPEIRLLYWPIFRSGVLTGRRAVWFAAHHDGIESLADAFGLAVMGLTLVGIVAAIARRRWTLLALLPFQLALVATYTLFFAEPRYRLPIELLALPFVVFALGEIVRLARALRERSRGQSRRSALILGTGLVVIVLWRFLWPALLDGGRALRARHRWAATEVGWLPPGSRPRLLLWKPVPPYPMPSPIEGAPNGVHLRVGVDGPARAHVRLAGGPVPAGRYLLSIAATDEGETPVRLSWGDGEVEVDQRAAAAIDIPLTHAGGPLELDVALRGSPNASLWISGERISAFDPVPR